MAALLTGLAVLPSLAGCGPSSMEGEAPARSGPRSQNEETEAAAAKSAALAFADGEWLSETFYFRVPDGAVAFELDHPAGWFVEDGDTQLAVRSDGLDDMWGQEVAGRFEVLVWDNECPESPEPASASNTVGGLGEPASAYEPAPDAPWDDLWSLEYEVCLDDRHFTAIGEVGPTTDPEVAAAYLALVERVAGSLKFVDLPLAEQTWETTQIQIDRVELSTPGTHPGRVQYDLWSIAHPASWSVSPAASDGEGWEMSGPLGDLSPGDEMTMRMAPLTVREWAETESGADASHLSNFHSAWRLPDEITPDGRRHMRYGIEGSHGKPWMVTADVPDLGEGSEETRQLELLMIHLLLRIERSQVIEFPEGYPGRP